VIGRKNSYGYKQGCGECKKSFHGLTFLIVMYGNSGLLRYGLFDYPVYTCLFKAGATMALMNKENVNCAAASPVKINSAVTVHYGLVKY
jgi:hypothetical protein